jgi:hypothetical protein
VGNSVNLVGQGPVRTVTTVCVRDSSAKIVKAQWNGIGADATTFVQWRTADLIAFNGGYNIGVCSDT